MKKQSFCYLFLLLVAGVCYPGLFSAKGTLIIPTNHTGSATACQAPPPSYFIATNVTPTSVSLGWGPLYSTQYDTVFFKLEGLDNTNSTALPTVYTTNYNYTYTGLTPGHNYSFTIRASYCSGGPWGDPAFNSTNSGVIITDFIVGIQECSPNQSRTIVVNEPFSISVQSSTTTPPQTLTNAYTAQFTYSGQTYKFSLGFVPTISTVYKEEESDPNNQFSFTAQNLGASAVCKYNGSTEIFTVAYVSSRGASASMVGLQVVFKEAVTNFTECGNYTPVGLVGKGTDVPEKEPENASVDRYRVETTQSNIISPNPFSTSATLQYVLGEESPVTIGLYDAMGRLVREVETTTLKAAGDHVAVADGAGLPDGVYFLRLQTARNREIFTLIKRE